LPTEIEAAGCAQILVSQSVTREMSDSGQILPSIQLQPHVRSRAVIRRKVNGFVDIIGHHRRSQDRTLPVRDLGKSPHTATALCDGQIDRPIDPAIQDADAVVALSKEGSAGFNVDS
jgi:hypothetical protein